MLDMVSHGAEASLQAAGIDQRVKEDTFCYFIWGIGPSHLTAKDTVGRAAPGFSAGAGPESV